MTAGSIHFHFLLVIEVKKKKKRFNTRMMYCFSQSSLEYIFQSLALMLIRQCAHSGLGHGNQQHWEE